MATREQRHAVGARRHRVWLSWLPEALVALVLLATVLHVELDLGHRVLGWEKVSPDSNPAEVLAPAGLDLKVGPLAPQVAATRGAGAVDPDAVRRALAPFVTDRDLGKHLSIAVSEVATGKIIYRRGAASVTPASTMKLLTGAAALAELGPMTRFATRVVAVGNRVVLIGGGDPYLATSPKRARGQYPRRADLSTLAKRTAAALKASGSRRVTLGYDAGLFTGPEINPRWPASYVPDGVVPPITALWADQGRAEGFGYAADPAAAAAKSFSLALARAGIAVVGPVAEKTAPASAAELARVESAPVGEIVQHVLEVSDNNAAEVLAHHVGGSARGDASFVGGSAGTLQVLRELGVPVVGSRVYDGSGLSRQDLLTPGILLGTLQAAASAEHPELRQAVSGLPVAGFTGSLKGRFDKGPAQARGRVRAKTGTLTGVRGLAGLATDVNGNLMAFVMIADRIALPDNLDAQQDLDRMAAALGACRCGPSS